MSIAFGVLGPLGLFAFNIVRDILGASQWVAKAVHGTFKMGAVLFSILGFIQQFYGSGGACGASGKLLLTHT